VGHNAKASFAGGVAVGAGAQATADPATALGNSAVASGNNSVALGASAKASATNSVALGAGSIASTANTVSIGSAGHERTISNVAAGVADTDAVNVGQLNAGLASTLSQANSYTDNQVNKLDHKASGGTAAALAMTSIPQAFTAGHGLVGMGYGSWNGESGMAVGGSFLLDDNHTAFKAAATFDSRGDAGVSAGVGWQF
jgi:autotransporter adhesin